MNVITIERRVLEKNDEIAARNRQKLRKHGIFTINMVSSPGAGKTSILERSLDILKRNVRVAVIEGDVQTDLDAQRVARYGVPAVQIVTRGGCHLEANLVSDALGTLDLAATDLLIIENVGNLVCPTDFPLGTDKRVVVISVTEGDDMVRKHPVIFSLADFIVINKIDLAKIIEVDPKILVRDARRIRPKAPIFLTDAKRGKGVPELMRAMGIW